MNDSLYQSLTLLVPIVVGIFSLLGLLAIADRQQNPKASNRYLHGAWITAAVTVGLIGGATLNGLLDADAPTQQVTRPTTTSASPSSLASASVPAVAVTNPSPSPTAPSAAPSTSASASAASIATASLPAVAAQSPSPISQGEPVTGAPVVLM